MVHVQKTYVPTKYEVDLANKQKLLTQPKPIAYYKGHYLNVDALSPLALQIGFRDLHGKDLSKACDLHCAGNPAMLVAELAGTLNA